jgi:hypothetical protein
MSIVFSVCYLMVWLCVDFLNGIFVVYVGQMVVGLYYWLVFQIRFVVHCVEFLPINWLHCVGVGANVMSNA